MREIEYRAWDKKHKYMTGIFTLDDVSKGFIGYKDNETMQYIGLKDKNGKKIFEGDIVNVNCGDYESIGVVTWEYGGFLLPGFVPERMMNEDDMEIIGNIYENPELLESKDD
jgi:hypothetical protein